MTASGSSRYRLLVHVVGEIGPHLPPGMRIKITPYRRWVTLQRADGGAIDIGPLTFTTDDRGLPDSSSGVLVRGLGTWIPLLPANLRRRLVAQDAVETVLGLAYGRSFPRREHHSDMHVRATNRADGLVVSYMPPDHSADRIELRPIPFELR